MAAASETKGIMVMHVMNQMADRNVTGTEEKHVKLVS
jgi:hypothetical protein